MKRVRCSAAPARPPISISNRSSRSPRHAGCDAIHPGYGFLSENAKFARRCAEEGITFVGPRAEILKLFGDKVQARLLAERCGVAVLPGTAGATSLKEAKDLLSALRRGRLDDDQGGRRRRWPRDARRSRRSTNSKRPTSAASRRRAAAFGNGDVYVEQLMPRARHIEVQIIGDGAGGVSHLWERECTIQRRNQKLVEVAPSPALAPRCAIA